MKPRYLIIEDEMTAFQLIKSQLEELRPDAVIVGPLQTTDEAVEYFENNPKPDIAFVDIHLADGSSFAIFEEVEVKCPIVFTTAYEEYALRAFDVNCIDYLLKPIDKEKLERALGKRELLSKEKIRNIHRAMTKESGLTHYNSCLLIPHRDKLIPVPVGEIAIIYLVDQMIKLRTLKGDTYYLTNTLEDVFSKLDPKIFYRANRQQIVSRHAVRDITNWFGHKISVNLTVETEEKIVISKTKVADFKRWLMGPFN